MKYKNIVTHIYDVHYVYLADLTESHGIIDRQVK